MIKKRISTVLKDQLEKPPPAPDCVADVDPFCSCPLCLADLTAADAARLLPKESRNAAFNLFQRAGADANQLLCSAINENGHLLGKEKENDSAPQNEASIAKVKEDVDAAKTNEASFPSCSDVPAMHLAMRARREMVAGSDVENDQAVENGDGGGKPVEEETDQQKTLVDPLLAQLQEKEAKFQAMQVRKMVHVSTTIRI